jgi:hypothetical protein
MLHSLCRTSNVPYCDKELSSCSSDFVKSTELHIRQSSTILIYLQGMDVLKISSLIKLKKNFH